MKRLPAVFVALLVATCVVACASGPVRRVSEPAAGIQQLTVGADGGWTVALRLDNFSSIPMRFDAVDLAVTVDGVAAGTLRGNAGITIGPESADVATLPFAPSAMRSRASQHRVHPGRPRGRDTGGWRHAQLRGRPRQRADPGARTAGRAAMSGVRA